MKTVFIFTLFSAFCLIFTLTIATNVMAQSGRGVAVRIKDASGKTKEVKLYEGSYALIIGNSEYSNGWDRLGGVKADVIAVKNVLERQGFKVETEENLTSERFEARIRKFINDYGYDRDNRLLFYYAGHGYTLNSAGDKRELGYIIPADTPLPDKDERGFRQKAVSMIAIQSFARQIQAKHALFVFDSCFSGKLFALRNTPKVTPFIYDKVDNPVRQFITAGDETQTVPDESIFRKAFVRGLEGEADRNNDGYIVGTELADYLKETVTNYSNRKQTPQFGTLNDIDLDKGDFVFGVLDKRSQKLTENADNNLINEATTSINTPSGSMISACGFSLGKGIADKWLSLGGANGFTGCLTTNETEAEKSPQGTTGRLVEFEGKKISTTDDKSGAIYWHRTGRYMNKSFVVYGGIYNLYESIGRSSSWLGFPIRDEYDVDEGRRNDFEGGYIVWNKFTGVSEAFKNK